MLRQEMRDPGNRRATQSDAQVCNPHRFAAGLFEPARQQNLIRQWAAANVAQGIEEIEEIKNLTYELLGRSFINKEGSKKLISWSDILFVTPYNFQVNKLQEALGKDARVGSVDKFQGQEAPIVIYSMTTSSYADAPRGMEFLYSLNRLNVATSRAKCICILVASPSVFEAQCRTPRQMQLANAFCRYLELAKAI